MDRAAGRMQGHAACLVGEGSDGAVDNALEARDRDLGHDEHPYDEGEGVGKLDVDRGEDDPPAWLGLGLGLG